MQWRLIEQESYNAPMNMAIDHAIYESVANGGQAPTIRFYNWKNNSVSIGAYQNQKEINVDLCRKNKVEIVRRITGGRAVFHDKNDFTYSVIAPINIFSNSIMKAYAEICSSIINSLSELGIKATLENKNDIMVNDKKISGNAAKLMDKGIYLQHGTLVYDINFELMPKVLNISEDLVEQKVTSILQHKKIKQQNIYKILKNNFMEKKDFKIENLSKFEMMRANDLAKTKYSTIKVPAGTLLKNKGACYVERSGN